MNGDSSITVRLAEVYNTLFAGNRIEVSFASLGDAESFRIRLHQYKSSQEKILVGLGMMSEDDVQKFVFRYDAVKQLARMKFQDRTDPRQYVMRIVAEEDMKEADGSNSSTS